MIDEALQERVDAYALGGLDPSQRADLEAHMAAGGPATREEREAFRRAVETAALLPVALPPSPPPASVWAGIVAAIRSGAAEAGARPLPPARRASSWPWLVAAAAGLLFVWALVDRGRQIDRAAELERRLDVREQTLERLGEAAAGAERARALAADCQRELSVLAAHDAFAGQAVALLELPGTQLIPLERRAPTGEAAANAIYHRGVKLAYVVVAGLPAGAAGAPPAYQVWIVRGGERLLAGTATPDASGRALVTVPKPTLEPGVPAAFQVTSAAGELVLESKMRI